MRLLPLLCCAALCLPGRAVTRPVRGPGTVVGYIGGSLSVSCFYQERYEKYPKYWCYPGTIKSCSYNTHLVITSEQQPWAQWGRSSIWDNRTARVFTVTVRDLTAGDAGAYRCGVRTHLWQMDVADEVRVIVLPGPTSASPSTSAITPGPISGPTCTPSQQETAEQTTHPSSSGDLSEGQLDVVMGILIPCIAVVLFFLTLAATVLVILSWKRKKALAGAPIEMGSTRGTADAEVLQYADISHVGTEQSHPYSNVRAAPASPQAATEYSEVKKPWQDLKGSTESLYVQVCKIPPEEQEQLYANMAPRQQSAAQ
ncbi:CMRF35-like molecule 8 [Centrocercus urophasianus]|uniref:CMRF35-like molecule 8 n=1 Tax=Centrocercus urophasianus TaxID=9002 RepID=UPI001C64DA0F|nr:CMRF35-like molecule 8 [Centrocercus urophasianus]